MSADEHTGLLTDRELLVRIDTRLQAVIEDKKDHETRIRKLEESRGTLEEKVNKAVTPKQLWAGVLGAAGLASATIPVVGYVVNK